MTYKITKAILQKSEFYFYLERDPLLSKQRPCILYTKGEEHYPFNFTSPRRIYMWFTPQARKLARQANKPVTFLQLI